MAPKKKQEKMNLGEFLTNQSLGSWADEMDAQPIMPAVPAQSGYGRDRDGGERRAFTQPAWETARTGSGVGGGMGRDMGSGMGGRGQSFDRPRFSEREQLPLPNAPPYTAHLGNLTYDVTQADIEDFFKNCQVTNVRIVEDKIDHKPKGFGYVEFATLDGLKTALTYSETNFMGRNVKISVAEPTKDRQDASRDFSDWSRKGPLPDLPQQGRQPSRGFSRNFNNDNMSDAGSERGGSRRPGFFEGDGKVRDFSNWERKGPLSPAPNAGSPVGDSGRVRDAGPPRERRQSPAWGEGRSDSSSRPPRREFEPRPVVERVPTAAEQDTQWRASMKPDPSPVATPDVSTPSSPQAQPPAERPKLNLAKRTVSSAVGDDAASNVASSSKASPFGAAKPIDTATKEREIEEKRQLAIREKRAADEKAKEEKTAKEAAARAARAERADRGQAQEDVPVTSPVAENDKGRRLSRQQNGTKQAPKENGEASTPTAAKPSFALLNRDTAGDTESEGVPASEDEAGEAVNGNASAAQLPDAGESDPAKQVIEGAVQDQVLSPQEVEDGWSTVAAKPKNNRRGGRPVAS